MSNISSDDLLVIEKALLQLHSHYVTQATRCRSFTFKCTKARQQQEERISSIKADWANKATMVRVLINRLNKIEINP